MTTIIDEFRNSGNRDVHQQGAPTLDVRNLTVRYEKITVLDDVTFKLETGERIAVIGPNGAGKSTLFKAITGIIPFSSGSIDVFGQNPDVHICIAYLPQRSHVDWRFPVSVADVVMMGRVGKLGLFRWPRRKDWDIVHKALEDVSLVDLAKRQISELSGGQQQRMFIARALAQEAELMLMDEPFTGLDVKSVDSIYTILDDLRLKKVTVMISTHDLDQAAEQFDRVILINRRLLGLGKAVDVFTPERLLAAYGGHLHLVTDNSGVHVVGDTCCEEGE
jgi:manganese/iron transport system ATP-binding protein